MLPPRVVQPPGGTIHAKLQRPQQRHHLALIGDDHLPRGGGRRSSQVGDQIRDGHIDLMTHRRYDRYFGGENSAGHNLLIKSPQVLRGSSPPSHDDDVGGVRLIELPDGPGDLLRGSGTLYGRRIQKDPDRGKTPGDDADDVLNGRTRRGGNHRYAAGKSRQRLLVLLIEKPLCP